jgi:hypothetical protein
MLLINVYHGCQILKTSHGTDYDIQAACTFSADEAINLRDLKRQVHADLELLPSQFNINISARINTAPAGSSFFYSLFGVVSDEIWGMIKTTAPYHLLGYKTLELVVESELISNSDNYEDDEEEELPYKMWMWMWMRMTKRKNCHIKMCIRTAI